MPIVVRHDPSIMGVAQVAEAAGKGEYGKWKEDFESRERQVEAQAFLSGFSGASQVGANLMRMRQAKQQAQIAQGQRQQALDQQMMERENQWDLVRPHIERSMKRQFQNPDTGEWWDPATHRRIPENEARLQIQRQVETWHGAGPSAWNQWGAQKEQRVSGRAATQYQLGRLPGRAATNVERDAQVQEFYQSRLQKLMTGLKKSYSPTDFAAQQQVIQQQAAKEAAVYRQQLRTQSHQEHIDQHFRGTQVPDGSGGHYAIPAVTSTDPRTGELRTQFIPEEMLRKVPALRRRFNIDPLDATTRTSILEQSTKVDAEGNEVIDWDKARRLERFYMNQADQPYEQPQGRFDMRRPGQTPRPPLAYPDEMQDAAGADPATAPPPEVPPREVNTPVVADAIRRYQNDDELNKLIEKEGPKPADPSFFEWLGDRLIGEDSAGRLLEKYRTAPQPIREARDRLIQLLGKQHRHGKDPSSPALTPQETQETKDLVMVINLMKSAAKSSTVVPGRMPGGAPILPEGFTPESITAPGLELPPAERAQDSRRRIREMWPPGGVLPRRPVPPASPTARPVSPAPPSPID